jgi:hypothetical protein
MDGEWEDDGLLASKTYYEVPRKLYNYAVVLAFLYFVHSSISIPHTLTLTFYTLST